MKKTFITQVPDKTGVFLSASRIISGVGANITRVSYNKAIDQHMLFIEVSAEEEQLDLISEKLQEIGYIMNANEPGQTILIECKLLNVPNTVLPVLELIERYHFNITYISTQENETDYQDFKVGLYIQNPEQTKSFLEEAAKICELHILNYDKSQKVLDNTVFYLSFARQVSQMLHLNHEEENAIITDSNRIMQMLDERNGSPYKTFSYIGKFAEMLHSFKGSAFNAHISKRTLKNSFTMHIIEPPCGSNTYILEKNRELLFIDCGFSCYLDEMMLIFRRLFPDFDDLKKSIILTHPDIDHCGLIHLFDTVYVSAPAYKNFALENIGEPNYREQNPLHAPYCRISKILSKYMLPGMHTLKILGENILGDPLTPIGTFTFHDLQLDLYAGNGGHNKGELVLVDELNKIIFTGDIVVNIKGFSKEQADFNALAPYLMTSVNMDSPKATAARIATQTQFDPAVYTYCCGHGAVSDPTA